MSRAHLIAAVAVALLLRWLTELQVTVAVAGAAIRIPVLLIPAAVALAGIAAFVALVVYRTRAERAMVAAWRARKAAAR